MSELEKALEKYAGEHWVTFSECNIPGIQLKATRSPLPEEKELWRDSALALLEYAKTIAVGDGPYNSGSKLVSLRQLETWCHGEGEK